MTQLSFSFSICSKLSVTSQTTQKSTLNGKLSCPFPALIVGSAYGAQSKTRTQYPNDRVIHEVVFYFRQKVTTSVLATNSYPDSYIRTGFTC